MSFCFDVHRWDSCTSSLYACMGGLFYRYLGTTLASTLDSANRGDDIAANSITGIRGSSYLIVATMVVYQFTNNQPISIGTCASSMHVPVHDIHTCRPRSTF